MNEEEVLLPTTEPELDAFVSQITSEYDLPEGDDTYDMIATMILHLPMTKAFQAKSFFGHGVLKSMANKTAFKKLQELKAKRDAKEKAEQEALEAQKQAETQPIEAVSDVEPVSNS